ncbi:hypothetical protein AURDEDRAFT_168321 [Auricularia subglabra TFB-10046 SS5]|nr:hypothetical protein AURDEDRAFT_168321 [Auricularia subglabra TFB-10046 SS5]
MAVDTHEPLAAPLPRADRLPWSILAKIFLEAAWIRGMPFEHSYYRLSRVIKLSIVCKHWRTVATAMPALWGYLDIPPSAPYRMVSDPERPATLEALGAILSRGTFVTIRMRVLKVADLEDLSLAENQRVQRRSLGMWLFFKVLLDHVHRWFKITVSVDHQLLVSRLLAELGKKENAYAPLGVFSLDLVADSKSLLSGPALNERREPPVLSLPGHKDVRYISLRNVLVDWGVSFFGVEDAHVPFPALRNLSITYPTPDDDPHRLWKVPSFDMFMSMLLSLPSLQTLDLVAFGPNEHTFPRLTQHSFLPLDELRSVGLSGMRPAYMARLLQYFELSRLTELTLYMGETPQARPMGLSDEDYEWTPVLAVLRGDMSSKHDWLSLKVLTTLKLFHIDAPWETLATVFMNAPCVSMLLIPATEAPAVCAIADEEGKTCVLPALRTLCLEGDDYERSVQVARMVRKALVQRARRMPRLKRLHGPDWLVNSLYDFGAHELYANRLCYT